MMLKRLIAVIAVIFMNLPAAAQNLEGDYLYKVTTVRAAPGKLEPLLDWIADLKTSDTFDRVGATPPFVMRHSQGDQWDILKIEPMESWSQYYSKSKIKHRAKAAAAEKEKLMAGEALVAFAEDHFAYGPPLQDMQTAFDANGFFHIEMFNAAPGKAAELFGQRQKENSYLIMTGQTPNMIFRRAAGSDVDVFTIGFHKSLHTFAESAPVTTEEKEEAAVAAGFKDLDDISFYLRSLISSHHDTLAVKVE